MNFCYHRSRVENIVAKEEIANDERFFFYHNVFKRCACMREYAKRNREYDRINTLILSVIFYVSATLLTIIHNTLYDV